MIKRLVILFALIFVISNSYAQNCSFTTTTSVNFGTYNPFSATPDNSVGALTVRCTGNGGPTPTILLSKGNSSTYARFMKSGINQMLYNLYADSAHSQVWGDGSPGTTTVQVPKKAITSVNVYGQIPAGQDVAVGSYTDSIVATVNF